MFSFPMVITTCHRNCKWEGGVGPQFLCVESGELLTSQSAMSLLQDILLSVFPKRKEINRKRLPL
jgi:hypothetical protein